MQTTSINKIRFVSLMVTFSIVLIFGIVFLILFTKFNSPVPENYVETQGTIVRIEEQLLPTYDERDGLGPDDYEHHVFIDYIYNDKTYSGKEYGNYDSSMKKGDTVLLYVNPEDPEDFISDPSGSSIFVIIGIGVIIVGAFGIAFNVYRKVKGTF